jgi:hypothetical protein
VVDSTGLRDTKTPVGQELNSLYGVEVNQATIDYGSHSPGENTGSSNSVTTARNTGNANIDIKVSGSTNFASGANTIPLNTEAYATSTFTYSSCAICQYLSGSATAVGVNIPKPTSTTTAQTHDIYWGIQVPAVQAAGDYSGTALFQAVTPGG